MREIISLNPDSLRQWQEEEMEPIRYGYDLIEGDLVLDIGSYQREWGKEMENRYGCRVEYFDALDNRAAWTHDGEIQMGGAFYYTSMFTPGGQKFGCVDIAPFLKQKIEVMKINIEGGEYELLNYIIDQDLIKNVHDIQVQFHLIEGTPAVEMYEWLAQRLSETHKLTWRFPFCWENWERK